MRILFLVLLTVGPLRGHLIDNADAIDDPRSSHSSVATPVIDGANPGRPSSIALAKRKAKLMTEAGLTSIPALTPETPAYVMGKHIAEMEARGAYVSDATYLAFFNACK